MRREEDKRERAGAELNARQRGGTNREEKGRETIWSLRVVGRELRRAFVACR